MNVAEIIQTIRQDHCTGCKVGLAIEALYKLGSPCLPVPSEAVKIAQPKKDKRRAAPEARTRTEKACNKCGVIKPLSAYPTNNACADGHTGACKACTSERHKENYLKKHAATSAPGSGDSEDSDLACKLCSARCSSANRLASHMRTVHGIAA